MEQATVKYVEHHLLVRAGITLSKSADNVHAHTVLTNSDRVYHVLKGTERYTRAQIEVIAQLDQIMNNTSIKRA